MVYLWLSLGFLVDFTVCVLVVGDWRAKTSLHPAQLYFGLFLLCSGFPQFSFDDWVFWAGSGPDPGGNIFLISILALRAAGYLITPTSTTGNIEITVTRPT